MKKFLILIVIACPVVFSCASKEVKEVNVNIAEKPSIIVRQQVTKMVRIKDGVTMERVNGAHRQISINSFYLGIFPVTQREYQEVMGTNPSFFKGDDLPVENITWNNAVEFCNLLSILEGLTPVYTRNGNTITWDREANGYRLPTDIEWEFACRAGTNTPFNTGNTITTSQANFDGRYPVNGSARGVFRASTTPVGMFAPNPWGLFDMHGNVWEWCWDDPNGTQTELSLLSASTVRVIRGGAWSSSGMSLSSSLRSAFQPFWSNNFIGFRVARNAQ